MAPTPAKSPLSQLFQLYTLDDILELIPEQLKVRKGDLEKVAKDSGIYRDLGGKMAFTESDVKRLFDHMRAVPAEGAAATLKGAGRLISSGAPAPNATGYFVLIGEQLNRNGYLFAGWAPVDGVQDLLTLVQYGYPAPLVALGWRAATPADVRKLKEQIVDYRVRTDSDGWYRNATGSYELLSAYVRGVDDEGLFEDEEDADTTPDNGAKS